MAEANAERRVVLIDEVIERIGPGEVIHTFMNAPFGLIGADHDRASLIAAMRTYGVEESGDQASALGHTLVIVKYPVSGKRTTPLFIEAKQRTELSQSVAAVARTAGRVTG